MNTAKLREKMRIDGDWSNYLELDDYENRRLFLCGAIISASEYDNAEANASTSLTYITEWIMRYNREDKGKPVSERKAIRLYINSPGGDVGEGFSLIAVMKLSKTPIHTINMGQWSSMAFLIGICGNRRLSFPYVTFLLHDGSTFAYGSTGKVQDRMEFDKRFEEEVIKNHVLGHSKMTSDEYHSLSRKEFYMLPEDALKYGFIDEIINDIDTIL